MLRTLWLSSAYVLGNEGGHGLHQCTWNQHGKVYNFAGNPISGGGFQPQSVYKCTKCQEGQLGKKFLESKRQPDSQKSFTLGIKTEVGFLDGKGQLLFQQDDDCTYYTDRLCENSCESCAGGIQMKPCNQK